MREKVFGHVQEMPLAFFSRTQTGALISRLNNDVLGRPAGLHRHPLLDRLQPHHRRPHRRGDGLPLVADHRRRPAAAPAVRLPGAPHRPQAAGPDEGGLQPERPDEQHDDGALQRLGRPAGQAVRPSGHRARRSSPAARPASATSAYRRPCTAGSSSCRSSSPRRSRPPSSTAGEACSPWTAVSRSARSSPSPRCSPASTVRSRRCRT